mmetsp:Transcript_28693/g.32788  ORF Transcript_28693/g.32788 Transcript_28693/m.32788 type:complete len:114 (-) Transcript_28693:120-461(-)
MAELVNRDTAEKGQANGSVGEVKVVKSIMKTRKPGNSTNSTQENSMNGQSSNESEANRVDRRGMKIDKSRKHKIIFQDEIPGHRLVDVREVECWKQYNAQQYYQPTGCSCTLL